MQNAYDDRQRRMVNYQVPEYVQDNDLVCFGLSSHDVEEWMPSWTPKAKADLDIVSTWYTKENAMKNLLYRPSTKSDWNYSNYATRAQLRVALSLALIRELPIKSFYARSAIVYAYLLFFISRGTGRGFFFSRPIVFYNHRFTFRALLNYPDLFWLNLTRIIPRAVPVTTAHQEWRKWQQPVYHQYHRVCYRYRFRRPRYVPWDGSQNQPVMPYLHDRGTHVINGTFTRNVNTTPYSC